MRAYPLKLLATVFAGLAVAGCENSQSAAPSVEHHGLKVEFTPVCVQGEIKLRGEIANSGTEPVRIESGALPWQYDLLGTRFQAESGGKPLSQSATMPLIGKTGPKVLAPNERREGFTPIGFIFPELKTLLQKQPVTVTWTYPLTAPSRGSEGQITGSLKIAKDPCEE